MSKQSPWSYNSLDTYNNGKYAMRVPNPAGTPNQSVQLVPNYGGISYDSVTNGDKAYNGGYYTIVNGYSSYPMNCTQFAQRSCSNS